MVDCKQNLQKSESVLIKRAIAAKIGWSRADNSIEEHTRCPLNTINANRDGPVYCLDDNSKTVLTSSQSKRLMRWRFSCHYKCNSCCKIHLSVNANSAISPVCVSVILNIRIGAFTP